MKILKKIILLTCGMAFLAFFSACKDQGPAEKVGESLDQAVEDTQEKMEEAGDAMQETAEEAGEKIEEAGEKIQKGSE